MWAYLGVIISGFILAFIGRQVAKIGTAFEATNHESTLQYVFGEKFSKVFDYILIFFLFGIAVTMIAGAGATFEESYNSTHMARCFNYDISDLYYVVIRL